MGGPRLNHIAHTARPMALLSAMATLLGALFICLSPPAEHHAAASATGASSGSTSASGNAAAEYTCPYDKGACGLMPLVKPAVLTAPPLDAPVEAGAQPQHLGAPPAGASLPRSGAQPRAPSLHVLQVLRT
ncbi:hypothetical protein [Streptomyces sp. NBC_01481]|uniref:hypothetical protein n=1 Tax=Streptomyces sp. NBC_01481 TaxID=2975869 RepID=UPI00224DED57|nr:hypothetical protein [Streptomyces sp. NBC_01481]MCX4582612.1 hypothetical protein [Streptomyces sp. NBC_01481]